MNLENFMERDGRMKVGFEGRFKGKIVKLREKGTSHATIQAKFRSCVKFQGRESKIERQDCVHLGAENAHILVGIGKSNVAFRGFMARRCLNWTKIRFIAKYGPKFERPEPNIEGVVTHTSYYYI